MDVAFKDLCLDANDPDAVAPFWATLLDLEPERQDGGDYRLAHDHPARTIWVNGVPERKTGKSRVHLDVRLDGEPPAGHVLREADDEIAWRVMADPEGLEWCAFGPRDGAAPGPFELVVDAVDPAAAAAWWAARTGAEALSRRDFWYLQGAEGFPYDWWVFNPVPEPKVAKNRMHWDVTLRDADVDGLVAAGARVLDVRPGWTVLADPEGNEFCAFART